MAQITLTQAEMCKAVEHFLNSQMFRMPHTVKQVKSTIDASGKGFKETSIVDNFYIEIEQKPIETPVPRKDPLAEAKRIAKETNESPLKDALRK